MSKPQKFFPLWVAGLLCWPLLRGYCQSAPNQPILPRPGNVVITEIMANPNPSQGIIPAREYLEIFNTTTDSLFLADCQLHVGRSVRFFPPDAILPPGEYRILGAPADTALFPHGAFWGIDRFPQLPNGGTCLRLVSTAESALDSVCYTDSWYRDPNRDGGGWSLERLSPQLPGYCPENWQAHPTAAGGSPGSPNPLPQNTLGRPEPSIRQVIPLDPWRIALYSTQGLALPSPAAASLLTLSPGPPITAILPGNSPYEWWITLADSLRRKTLYTLALEPGWKSCMETTSSQPVQRKFGLPEPLHAGDLRINELLFNPFPGAADFIEIYHAGQFPAQMRGIVLENTQLSNGRISQTLQEDYLLLPGELLVISPDTASLGRYYPQLNQRVMLQHPLPTWPDKQGNATLRQEAIILDSFDYSADWHSPWRTNPEGISLERIQLDEPTQDPENWESAGGPGATPGLPNSQRASPAENTADWFIVDPPYFTPNNDGNQDYLTVHFQPRTATYTLNIRIFTPQGRAVRHLASNLLLGSQDTLTWNGHTDDGRLAPPGIYIVWMEFFNLQGQRHVFKWSCTLVYE
ncbi:MAG: lamin tail domain-containing protein [Lewinellaceae bacterium]|nr:lamin tail domain-containing protein [Lewinellaceae bacterium]